MLIDDLKRRTTQAMKEKDEVSRDVLRLALGELQMAEVRGGKPLTEEEAVAVVRKLVKSNEETLGHAGEGERAEVLKKEITLLNALLPATMGVAQIAEALASQKDAIRAAKNDGQATGIAMKHLKSTGGTFDGTLVAAAVKQLRA